MIVRRTRLIGAQAELWPDWRHFAFVTNRTDPLAIVEAEHRQHAVVEQAIRDLKDQALAHFPSGHYAANAAWTVIAALAHNLIRWTALIGLPDQTAPRRAHPAPPTAHDPRPPHPQRPPLDAASARPLALGSRLHPSAHHDPSAPRRLSTRRHTPTQFPPPALHPAAQTAARPLARTPSNTPPRPRPQLRDASDGINWPHHTQTQLTAAPITKRTVDWG